MALPPGTRFGPYETAAVIGIGGMGGLPSPGLEPETRRRDQGLAAVFLRRRGPPDALPTRSRNARRVEPPELAHIYGLERADGMTALVAELVDGPTLAERVAHGALPVDEALPIAMQIADALGCARTRDLMVTNNYLRSGADYPALNTNRSCSTNSHQTTAPVFRHRRRRTRPRRNRGRGTRPARYKHR